jgi:TonB family protein
LASPALQATRPRGADVRPHPAADIVVISTRDDFLLGLGAVIGANAAVRSVESLSMALEHMGAPRHAHIFVFDTRGMADLRNCVGRAYARAPDAAILLFADAAAEESMRRMFKDSKVLAVLPIPLDAARTALVFADALTDASARKSAVSVHIEAAPARTTATPAHIEAAPARTTATPAHTEAAPARAEAGPARTAATPAHIEAAPARTAATLAHIEAAPARTAATPAHIEAAPARTAAAPARIEAEPASLVAARGIPPTSLTPINDGWGFGTGAALVILACAWFIAADKHAVPPGPAAANPGAPVKQAPVNGSAYAELPGAAKAAQELPVPASTSPLQAPQAASSPPNGADHPSAPQSRLNLIRYVVPEYPATERARRMGGTVIVAYTIDTHGATRHVRVISSEPHGIFDHDAVDAVKLWRYAPVMVDDAAVAVPTRSTIHFTPP